MCFSKTHFLFSFDMCPVATPGSQFPFSLIGLLFLSPNLPLPIWILYTRGRNYDYRPTISRAWRGQLRVSFRILAFADSRFAASG
ncbi:hypothetical protein B296_00043725 [Ensete ventricosum]|uniref:Uncharacterized protein n=1 Tax=Ensete ventricosum TaxID=4639 RepID=A0A426X4A0_ENSVE|nr:hypothetical protein B296_00043725 [Ensete ventricosum]